MHRTNFSAGRSTFFWMTLLKYVPKVKDFHTSLMFFFLFESLFHTYQMPVSLVKLADLSAALLSPSSSHSPILLVLPRQTKRNAFLLSFFALQGNEKSLAVALCQPVLLVGGCPVFSCSDHFYMCVVGRVFLPVF